VAKSSGEKPSDLRDYAAKKKKKEDLNYSGKTEWPADAGGHGGWP